MDGDRNRGHKVRWTIVALVGVFVAIQFVPHGRAHENPPVTGTPDWDTARTRELARRACFDCHSNETDWPWYSWVAPASWIVTSDVHEAREHLNFSEFDQDPGHADEAAEMVRKGEMPLDEYELLHPDARLSDAEREELIAGLQATFAGVDDGHEGHQH